ncbi:hypothetical protein HYV80_00500 [Candidatus Woesearchaeota archaeon]|nr:hypothetical protein [Candidatus Woesearchaeota archaeon]
MEKDVIVLEGKPYYLQERNAGIFEVVTKITLSLPNQGELDCEYDSGMADLVTGQDITETNTRGLELCVSVPVGVFPDRRLIEDLRAFGEISGHDYVAFVILGDFYANKIKQNDAYDYYTMRPRIFKPIVPIVMPRLKRIK